MDRFSLFLAASLGAFLWTNPVRAVPCVPTPGAGCPSDSIQITDGTNIINDINGNPASAVFNEGDLSEGTFFDFAVPPPAGLNLGPNYLVDGGFGNRFESASDSFSAQPISTSSGTPFQMVGIRISFQSDRETVMSVVDCAVSHCIGETGSPEDVTAVLFPGVAAPPFHVIVQSDLSEVPEPGTFVLLGAGLAAIGARRYRV